MSSRKHKDALYEQLARIGKAASAPRRLELLDLLVQAPRTVEALASQTAMLSLTSLWSRESRSESPASLHARARLR